MQEGVRLAPLIKRSEFGILNLVPYSACRFRRRDRKLLKTWENLEGIPGLCRCPLEVHLLSAVGQ